MALSLSDYLDSSQFPVTSRKLSPKDQFRIDAFNYDALRSWITEGNDLSNEQADVWRELQIKVPAQKRLSKEIE